jgi:hypothetical protein
MKGDFQGDSDQHWLKSQAATRPLIEAVSAEAAIAELRKSLA